MLEKTEAGEKVHRLFLFPTVNQFCSSVRSELQSVKRAVFSPGFIVKLIANLVEIKPFELNFNATLYYATTKMYVS